MEALHNALGLTLDAELAVEIDPRTLAPEIRECLARNGINRASLAVQAKIYRIQPFGLMAAGEEALRKSGIESINFDLISSLSGQTEARVAETALHNGCSRSIWASTLPPYPFCQSALHKTRVIRRCGPQRRKQAALAW